MISRDGRASLGSDLEAYRPQLVAHCYRMLGSPFDAQDAAQEALSKAWRQADRYDPNRGAYRTWLYAITTNVCLDLLRGRQRRLRAADLAPPAGPSSSLGEVVAPHRWVEPLPDALITPVDDGPEAVVLRREDVRLALIAALQHLPSRQRAVLLLRQVVGLSAAEVGEILSASTAAVNSALQRARASLADVSPESSDASDLDDEGQRQLLERYIVAFEAQDHDALVALLTEDAEMEMPPLVWWLQGRDAIEEVWHADPGACAGSRLLPTRSNGGPAVAQYVWSDEHGRYEPQSLTVLELDAGRIRRLLVQLDTARWFPLFGLPLELTGLSTVPHPRSHR